MTARIDLSAEHRQLVLGLLAELLPASARVWVFGSRATGRARRYSDLDLAIDAGRPLSLDEAALLREAFEESDLPYRVDIVDWHAIGATASTGWSPPSASRSRRMPKSGNDLDNAAR